MIDKSLEVLANALLNFFRLTDINTTNQEIVKPVPLVKFDGSLVIPEETIGITLVNIEEERVTKAQKPISLSNSGIVSQINPEIKLNLFTLITANFKEYDTGLQYLSGVVRCFQANNVFTKENTPHLDNSIKKLIVDLYTLSFEQQNHLWGALGAKYMPSVLYKARLIAIQEAQKKIEYPPITDIKVSKKINLPHGTDL